MSRFSNLRLFLVAGLLVAVGLAVFVSPFADPNPDGLEKVAEQEGFIEAAREHDLGDGPVADYAVEGVDDGRVATALAGLIGVCITFGVGLALFAAMRAIGGRSEAQETSDQPSRA